MRTRRLHLVLVLAITLGRAAAAVPEWCRVAGPAGAETDLDLVLRLDGERVDGNALRRHSPGATVLKGTMGKDGAVRIDELVAGKPVGTFEGKLAPKCDALDGVWKPADASSGAKPVAVKLTRNPRLEAQAGDAFVLFTRGPIERRDATIHWIEAYRGSGPDRPLCAYLRRMSDRFCGATCGSLDAHVSLASQEMIAVSFFQIASSNWALGSNQTRQTVNRMLALGANGPREVAVTEWLVPRALDRLTELAKPLIRKQLKGASPAALARFRVGPDGVTISKHGFLVAAYFDGRAVEPVARGTLAADVSVLVALDDARGLVRAGTPLARALR